MSRTASCPEPPHVQHRLMSRTASCPEPPHVQNRLMSRTASCPEPPHVQNRLISRTTSCTEPPHLQQPERHTMSHSTRTRLPPSHHRARAPDRKRTRLPT